MAGRRRRLTRKDFARGLYGYHDPTAGIGAAPARSALTLRLVLAAFGLLFCTGAACFAFAAGLNVLGYILALLAVIALVDLAWVAYRKYRGEPGIAASSRGQGSSAGVRRVAAIADDAPSGQRGVL
jgi:hypothetical protein